MRAAVVAHGEPDEADRRHVEHAELVVAADGGALIVERWGLVPSVVIGDLDSLGPERAERLGSRGATVIAHPAAKDETDTELAVAHALERGADRVTILAAFGGARVDHAMANVMLLADDRLRGRDVRAVRGATSVRALFAGDRLRLDGAVGDVVSLVPVAGDAGGVTTDGLRFALADDTLALGAARGVSNVIDRVPASVSLRSGKLLVFEIARGGVA